MGPKRERNFDVDVKKLGTSQLGLMHESDPGQGLVPKLLCVLLSWAFAAVPC